ncbi:hypothetical protein E2986_00319 [Frieseomelitta varia]|uniref:RBD domain-containing protein n=1 Tax=Frieseomelitta varia TaxID=561572 RepID=A0A833WAL7_9HYME|nr:hypothetical protein E2986_00319 [Frieseomelitta varia]
MTKTIKVLTLYLLENHVKPYCEIQSVYVTEIDIKLKNLKNHKSGHFVYPLAISGSPEFWKPIPSGISPAEYHAYFTMNGDTSDTSEDWLRCCFEVQKKKRRRGKEEKREEEVERRRRERGKRELDIWKSIKNYKITIYSQNCRFSKTDSFWLYKTENHIKGILVLICIVQKQFALNRDYKCTNNWKIFMLQRWLRQPVSVMQKHQHNEVYTIMVEPKWSIKCMNSTLNLLNPSSSYTDLKTLHKKHCKKYFCLCKRHTISVICINETRKLYWFNCKNVREKVNFGLGDGYYYKLLRIINSALNTWAQHYIDGLSIARKEIMFKINGTAKKNMKLLKEGCYCHYHPHMTADACNADFLKKVLIQLICKIIEFVNCIYDRSKRYISKYTSLMSDDDKMSLTTAVSDDDDGESVINSPYRGKQTGTAAASFNCTGAVRKAGFLSVKKWLLRKKHQIELARKRGWKGYWVCLKGTTLLFYPCDSQESRAMEAAPKHLIIVDGAIMQPIPEHPKRDYIFCLSTAFGDAYLFQDHKLKHMADLQQSVVSDVETRQQINNQIIQWEENLERLHCEQFRLRCYMASLQSGELPNPKSLLTHVSRATKQTLNKLGVFTVSSFHAFICARSPSLLNNLLAGRGATKRRPPLLSRSNSGSSRRSLQISSRDDEKTVKVYVPENQLVSVFVRDAMTVEEFLASACNRKNLNPMEHFVRVKKRRDMEDHNYFVPHRTDMIETYLHTHEIVEVCAKILYQVELQRNTLEQMWGFSVEAELIENSDRQDELCCYVSRVEDKSVAMQNGKIISMHFSTTHINEAQTYTSYSNRNHKLCHKL